MKNKSILPMQIIIAALFLAAKQAQASTGMGALGGMIVYGFFIFVGGLLAVVIAGFWFGKKWGSLKSIIIALLAAVTVATLSAWFLLGPAGNFEFTIVIIFCFAPLLACSILVLARLFGSKWTSAACAAILFLSFAWVHLPQYDTLSVKKFNASGEMISDISRSSYRFGTINEYFPPSRRIFHGRRIAASAGNYFWFAINNEIEDKRDCSGFTLKKLVFDSVSSKGWERCIGFWDKGQTQVTPVAIATDTDQGVFVIGYDNTYNRGDYAASKAWWIKRFNINGEEDRRWNLTFRDKYNDKRSGDQKAYSLARDNEGNVYVVGERQSTTDGKGNCEIWMRKFNREGKEVQEGWNKTFLESNDNCYSPEAEKFPIVTDMLGSVYVVFVRDRLLTVAVHGPHEIIYSIKKFTSEGVELWDKELVATVNPTYPAMLFTDGKENLFVLTTKPAVANHLSYQPWIKKFDLEGQEDLRWNKIISTPNGRGIATLLSVDSERNVYLAGYYNGPNSLGIKEAYLDGLSGGSWWLKKYQADGTEFSNWDRIIIQDSKAETPSILANSAEHFYVVSEGEGFLLPFLEMLAR